jgi:hypothetical protein
MFGHTILALSFAIYTPISLSKVGPDVLLGLVGLWWVYHHRNTLGRIFHEALTKGLSKLAMTRETDSLIIYIVINRWCAGRKVFFENLRIRERFGSDRFQGRFSSYMIGLFSYSFDYRGYLGRGI